jgi:hypothetical protein
MPQVEPYGPFKAGDPVSFIFDSKGANIRTSLDGGVWSPAFASPLTVNLGSSLDPGPHYIRAKAEKGAQSSLISEWKFYIKP